MQAGRGRAAAVGKQGRGGGLPDWHLLCARRRVASALFPEEVSQAVGPSGDGG